MDNAIILVGPPGSGKSTLARKAVELGYDIVEMSSILKINQRFQNMMNSGSLVPDQEVIGLLNTYLKDNKPNKPIFVGVPRTLAQAQMLLTMLWDDFGVGNKIAVVEINVEKETLFSRLSSRDEGRKDDSEDIILNRLDIFEEKTRRALIHLGTYVNYHDICGNRQVEEVFSDFSCILNQERIRTTYWFDFYNPNFTGNFTFGNK